jgi:hypothetical protein
VARRPGDATPFLVHLEKLLPDETDRGLLLCYLVNAVQNVGHKFQFAPLLVGPPGNGKTLLSRCAAHAVGTEYAFWPTAKKMGGQFNAWMRNHVLYLVEDAFFGGKDDLIEAMKPLITGEFIEIEGKGVDQLTGRVCGNFIFNANRRDAIKKTIDDRRYMTLWCAQEGAADLERDGLTPAYFASLHGWLGGDGHAIVTDYLHTYSLPPGYGLAWAKGRAPQTSSTARAIEATRSPVEQEVLAAVDEDRPGFRGGWISSFFLHGLIEKMGRAREVQRSQYAPLLEALGYVPHPALASTGGQVHNSVMPDGGKPKLFVKFGSPAAQILKPAEVGRAYSLAQGLGGVAPLPPA